MGESMGTDTDTAHRIERALGDFRVEVASSLSDLRARLEAQREQQRDHEPRLRRLETTAVTKDDVHEIVTAAVQAVEVRVVNADQVREIVDEAVVNSRRLSWKDLGGLLAAGAATSAIALGLAQLL